MRRGLTGTPPPGGPPAGGAGGLNGTPPPSEPPDDELGGDYQSDFSGMPPMAAPGGNTPGQEWVQAEWPGAPGFGRAIPGALGGGGAEPVEGMPADLARRLQESLNREKDVRGLDKGERRELRKREYRMRADALRAHGRRLAEGGMVGAVDPETGEVLGGAAGVAERNRRAQSSAGMGGGPGGTAGLGAAPGARGGQGGQGNRPLEVTAQTVQVTVPQNGTVVVNQGAPPGGPYAGGAFGRGGPMGTTALAHMAAPEGAGAFGRTGITGTRGLQPLGGQPGVYGAQGGLIGPPAPAPGQMAPAWLSRALAAGDTGVMPPRVRAAGRGVGDGGGGGGLFGEGGFGAIYAAERVGGTLSNFAAGALRAGARFDRSAWENAYARGLLGTGAGMSGLGSREMQAQIDASGRYRISASPAQNPLAGVLGLGNRRSAERYMDPFEQERTETAFRQRVDPTVARGDPRMEQIMRVATMTNTQGPELVASLAAAGMHLGVNARSAAGSDELNRLFMGGFGQGFSPQELEHLIAMGGPGLREAGMTPQQIMGAAVVGRRAGLEDRSTAFALRQVSNLALAPSGPEFYELQRLFGSGAPSATRLQERVRATQTTANRVQLQQQEQRLAEGSPWRQMEDLGFSMQQQSLDFAERGNLRQERGFARSEANIQRGYGALSRQGAALGRGAAGLERAQRGRQIDIEYNRFRYGADTPQSFSRDAYFAQQRAAAEAARTGGTIPDAIQQNAPGFEARQFYGGVEHQRRMLVYGQTPWLAGAAYEEQQAELTRQEQMFQEQAAAEIPGRALQAEERDAQLADRAAELADHRAALADSRADLDASREALTDQREALGEERSRLLEQQKMLNLQVEAHRLDLKNNWDSLTIQQELLAQQAGLEEIERQPTAEEITAFREQQGVDPVTILRQLGNMTDLERRRTLGALGMEESSASGSALMVQVAAQRQRDADRAEIARRRAAGEQVEDLPESVLQAPVPTPGAMESIWDRFTETAVGRWLRSAVPGMRTEANAGLQANASGWDTLESYIAAAANVPMGGPNAPGAMVLANAAGVAASAAPTVIALAQLRQWAQMRGLLQAAGQGGAALLPGAAATTATTAAGTGGGGALAGVGGALAPLAVPAAIIASIAALTGGAVLLREHTQSEAEQGAMRLSPEQQRAYAAARAHGYDERISLQIAESRVMEGANEAQWQSLYESTIRSPIGLSGELSRRGRGGWTAWGEQGLAAPPALAPPGAGGVPGAPGAAGTEAAPVTSQGIPGAPVQPGQGAPGQVVAPVAETTFNFPGMTVTVTGDISEEQKQRLGEEVGTLVVTAIKDAAAAARP